jgi:pilus assembly protein CpaC
MIHHSVDGGKSTRRKVRTASGLWRGWSRNVIGVCAGVLAVVGGSRAAAQSTSVPLPPIGSPEMTRYAPDLPPPPPALPQPATPQPAPSQADATQPVGARQPAAADLGKPTPLGAPRPLVPFGPAQVRLPRLPGAPGVVGATPNPTADTVKDYARYVGPILAPNNTITLMSGRPFLINFKDVPKRIQIADDHVAEYKLITPLQLSLLPKDIGTTVLNLWFVDADDKTKEKVLCYLVRVVPDSEYRKRLEDVYSFLEVEINTAFPDSRVMLRLCGDKLYVCGQAKDIAEATHIMDFARANMPGGWHRETPGQATAKLPLDRLYHDVDPRAIPPEGTPPGVEDYPTSGPPAVINLLRIAGEQQVMLQVTVAEVNRAAARAIGLNFNIFNKHGAQVVANNVGGIVPVIGNQSFAQFIPTTQTVTGLGTSVLGNIPVALDNGQIQLAISALRELNYSRSLAEPTLTTMNGQTASFQAGGLFPIPFLTAGGLNSSILQGVGYIPTGVQLSFTPYITDKDRIRLQVAAEVSDRDPTLGATIIAGSEVPSLITRNFQTTVELREGQTLAVAGLIQNRLGANASRVPLFGDIPIIGRLAAFDRIAAEEQELVILITPELVHPMEPKQVPPLPGSDLFEPGDLEFYLLGRLESRRSYDYRSPAMTDLNRMARYRHCEQIYITGPYGHCADGGCAGPVVHE